MDPVTQVKASPGKKLILHLSVVRSVVLSLLSLSLVLDSDSGCLYILDQHNHCQEDDSRSIHPARFNWANQQEETWFMCMILFQQDYWKSANFCLISEKKKLLSMFLHVTSPLCSARLHKYGLSSCLAAENKFIHAHAHQSSVNKIGRRKLNISSPLLLTISDMCRVGCRCHEIKPTQIRIEENCFQMWMQLSFGDLDAPDTASSLLLKMMLMKMISSI